MKNAAQTTKVFKPASAARNIQAIWSHKQSANTSHMIGAELMIKESYVADRATD